MENIKEGKESDIDGDKLICFFLNKFLSDLQRNYLQSRGTETQRHRAYQKVRVKKVSTILMLKYSCQVASQLFQGSKNKFSVVCSTVSISLLGPFTTDQMKFGGLGPKDSFPKPVVEYAKGNAGRDSALLTFLG